MSNAHLRARIFTLLGIAAIVPLTSPATADSGDTSGGSDEICIVATDGMCPASADVTLTPDAECALVSVDGEATLDATAESCCYPVTVECKEQEYEECGCYGRPFVLEGRPVQAPAAERSDWARGPVPALAGLSASQRARLAQFWTDNGLAEHSSVAGFARFALDLCAHGAPPELVHRALVAAVEETAHARLCFALATAYADAPVGPGALEMNGAAPVARTLVELAVHTAREGAIGETLSAYIAAEMLARATDPAVRHVLEQIVREEGRHAELAWATLKWAIAAGGEPVRAAVAAELATAGLTVPDDLDADAVLEGHGLVSAARLRRCVDEGVRTLVAPAAAALTAVGPARRAGEDAARV